MDIRVIRIYIIIFGYIGELFADEKWKTYSAESIDGPPIMKKVEAGNIH